MMELIKSDNFFMIYQVFSFITFGIAALLLTYFEGKSCPLRRSGIIENASLIAVFTCIFGSIPVVSTIGTGWQIVVAFNYYMEWRRGKDDVWLYIKRNGYSKPHLIKCTVSEDRHAFRDYVYIDLADDDYRHGRFAEIGDEIGVEIADIVRVDTETYIEMKLTGRLNTLIPESRKGTVI